MPFTAVCQYCRGSKFRVPFKKRGTFATCPKCAHEFMLVPESGVDVPLMEYNHLPFDDDDDPRSPPSAAEVVLDDVSDTSTTAPQNVATAVIPAVVPAAVPAGDFPDYAVRTALAACGFVGVSMIASQFPYGRFVAAPLAGVGLVLGAVSLLGLEARKWLGGAAVGLNALALLLVLAFPDWLGLSSWTPAGDPESAPKPVTAVGRDGSLPKTADWVDAGREVWQQGDVRITVVGVTAGPLDPTAKDPAKRKDRALRLTLKLTNVGVARAIEFTSWSPSPTAETKLTAAGTALVPRAVTADKATLYPGKSAESVLTFAAPDKFDDLRLEIPPEAFGGTSPARFLIPKTLLGGR